jgi:type IV pilus assembly protein PilA
MSKLLQKKSGFTLIELMIVVAILGILAALAVPAFIGYMRRAKTGEATQMLNNMFKLAASYYAEERQARGIGGDVTAQCVVGSAAATPALADIGEDKIPFVAAVADVPANFASLGFTIQEPVYFSYQMGSVGAGCGVTAADIYTFYAHGDLDGDTTYSTFELYAGPGLEAKELVKSRAFFIANETE